MSEIVKGWIEQYQKEIDELSVEIEKLQRGDLSGVCLIGDNMLEAQNPDLEYEICVREAKRDGLIELVQKLTSMGGAE